MRPPTNDLEISLKNFEQVTEALGAENGVGRWYWKTGMLKNDDSIPWEEQNINTCPENFLWEENKTSILTVSPGVYELKGALFSNKNKPGFDVMINGIKGITQTKQFKYNDEENESKIGNEPLGIFKG